MNFHNFERSLFGEYFFEDEKKEKQKEVEEENGKGRGTGEQKVAKT